MVSLGPGRVGGTSNLMKTFEGISLWVTQGSHGSIDQVTSKVFRRENTSGMKDMEMGVCGGWI